MDIKDLILQKIEEFETVKVSDIVKETGFSRTYINRFFNDLEHSGKIVLIGKANKAHYVKANKKDIMVAKRKLLVYERKLKNQGLLEDVVLEKVRRDTGILIDINDSVNKIFAYAFTEILNNAIDHSMSEFVEIKVKKDKKGLYFEIKDWGIVIFNNLIKQKGLKDSLEAIQFLTKGKQTTAPEAHSGEGIFFTSKLADSFIIESFGKKIIFNNIIEDIFISDIKVFKGTKVSFFISLNSKKDLGDVFREYSDEMYDFSKTKIVVKLFKIGELYMSRSQAKRVMYDLDKFKTVVLDFKGVDTVGQAFADEIFRVWHFRYPKTKIVPKNMNENVEFMVNRSIN